MLDSTHRAWASTEKRTPRMYDAGLPLKKQRTVTRTNSDRDHDRSRDALRTRILHEVDHMQETQGSKPGATRFRSAYVCCDHYNRYNTPNTSVQCT